MTNFNDTMTYTMIVTLFGMGIVFIVLVFLQYILKSMPFIFREKKKSDSESTQVLEVETAATAASQVTGTGTVEDEQLVAVITAAVISCLGGNSNIVVRNIRRVNDLTPAWGKASRMEQMNNRF